MWILFFTTTMFQTPIKFITLVVTQFKLHLILSPPRSNYFARLRVCKIRKGFCSLSKSINVTEAPKIYHSIVFAADWHMYVWKVCSGALNSELYIWGQVKAIKAMKTFTWNMTCNKNAETGQLDGVTIQAGQAKKLGGYNQCHLTHKSCNNESTQ